VLADSFSRLSLQSSVSERGRAVNDVLEPSLGAASEFQLITENDDCFAPARRFRDQWAIKPNQWHNFARLLCGSRHIPLILLLNPSNAHSKSYEEMIQCDTIDYISDLLKCSALPLTLVPILDVCSLFSDEDLQAMDGDRRREAVEAAYKLTEDILAILQPKLIICCQCATRSGAWKEEGDGAHSTRRQVWEPAMNQLARQLCSSVRDAKNARATPIDIHGHTAWVIKGFHPRYAKEKPSEKEVLVRLFKDIYEPCKLWKARLMIDRLDRMIIAVSAFVVKLEAWKSEFERICLHSTIVQSVEQVVGLTGFKERLMEIRSGVSQVGN
ncbi:hypothetical protein K456DRAFT_1852011, partial [Colletotrichum gloeosporioides 23]